MNRVRWCASFLAGMFGLSGAALAAENVTLRLRFQAGAPEAPVVLIDRVDRQEGMAIPLPLDTDESRRAWWLSALDAQGRELFRQPVRNPQRRRMEAFDPATGKIADVRDVVVTQGAFEVSFRYDARVARVVLRNSEAHRKGQAGQATALLDIERPWLDRQLRANPRGTNAKAAAATLLDSGSAADRLDLVFVGDGYTEAELSKWRTDATTVVNGLMADPLFQVNRRRINIRRVDVASVESGVDEPDRGIFRDTAMDAAFNCANIDRLLCVNTTKVLSIVGSVLEPNARDVIIVVANSTRYGGSGGSVAAISMHASTVELALHELGHTLFGLADEYDYGSCNLGGEPSSGNASTTASRGVKWGGFITPLTAVPTSPGQYPNGTVGLFEGAQYCPKGKFRPTEDSKMRTLGRPWHVINEVIAADVFVRYSGNLDKPRIRLHSVVGTDAHRTPSPPGADRSRAERRQTPQH